MIVTTRRTFRASLRELLLSGAALAGVLCLAAAAASFAFHIRPLVFRSGSMSPEIRTGALALARQVPATDLIVGDVVSVLDVRGVRITHRIRAVHLDGPVATLVLQGDANRVPDAEPYVVTHADRLFCHVNRLGYVVAWLGHRSVVFAGGVLVGVLGAYAFRRDAPAPRERAARRGPPGAGASVLVLAVAAAATLLAPRATNTAAAFTDAGRALSGTLSAHQVPAPPTLGCTAGVGAVTFAWTAASVPLTLVVRLGTATSRVALPAGQSSYRFTAALGTGNGSAVLERSEAYTSTTWASTGNSRTIGIFLGVLSTCT